MVTSSLNRVAYPAKKGGRAVRSKEELMVRVGEALRRDPFLVELGQRAPTPNKAREAAQALGLSNEDEKCVKDAALLKKRVGEQGFLAILRRIQQEKKEQKVKTASDGILWKLDEKGKLWVALEQDLKLPHPNDLKYKRTIPKGTLVELVNAGYGGNREVALYLRDEYSLRLPLTWDEVVHPDVCILTKVGFDSGPKGQALYCAARDKFVGVTSGDAIYCPLCGRGLERTT